MYGDIFHDLQCAIGGGERGGGGGVKLNTAHAHFSMQTIAVCRSGRGVERVRRKARSLKSAKS